MKEYLSLKERSAKQAGLRRHAAERHRRAVNTAEARVKRLQDDVSEITARKQELEKDRYGLVRVLGSPLPPPSRLSPF